MDDPAPITKSGVDNSSAGSKCELLHTREVSGGTAKTSERLSLAQGIAVAIALVRGFARTKTNRLGNFWVDLVRINLRVLLPLSVPILAVVFILSFIAAITEVPVASLLLRYVNSYTLAVGM